MLSPMAGRPIVQPWQVRLNVVTPGALVVSLAEAKSWLRITNDSENTVLNMLIATAQGMVEKYTGRFLSPTVVEGYSDGSPYLNDWWSGVLQMPMVAIASQPRTLLLPGLPLTSVESFKFVDLSGTETTFAADTYYADASDPDRPGRIVLRYFTVYPGVPREIKALKVNYTVGYTTNNLPAAMKQAVLMMVSYLYDNRGECADAGEGVIANSGVQALLSLYRSVKL